MEEDLKTLDWKNDDEDDSWQLLALIIFHPQIAVQFGMMKLIKPNPS